MNKSVLRIILTLAFITICFLTFFSSCTEDHVQVEELIFNHNNSVKYTVQAQITNRVSKHFVFIGEFTKLSTTTKDIGVSGAYVVVSDGKNEYVYHEIAKEDLFFKDKEYKSGFYRSDDYFRGEPNKKYRLSITIGDKTYSATETMPLPEDITKTELELLDNPSESWFFGQQKTAIFFDGERDRDYFNSVVSHGLLSFSRLRPEASFSSSSIVDPIGEKIKYPSSFNDRHSNDTDATDVMYRYTLSEGYKDYLWGYMSQTTWNNEDIVSTEPGNLRSNFDSPEVIGYFSAIANKAYKRHTSELYPINTYKTEKVFSTTYPDKGEIKMTFNPSGQCVLEGMGMSMKGAYEIRRMSFNKDYLIHNPISERGVSWGEDKYDDDAIIVDFSSSYNTKNNKLYDFYINDLGVRSFYGDVYPRMKKLRGNDIIGFVNLQDHTIQSFGNQIWCKE